jgi:hypothetical protein
LLELAKQLGNISQACKIMGRSRDSFYRFASGRRPAHRRQAERDRRLFLHSAVETAQK